MRAAAWAEGFLELECKRRSMPGSRINPIYAMLFGTFVASVRLETFRPLLA